MIGLISRHQRAPTRIAQEHHLLDARLLSQPFHALTNIDQCVLEQEEVLEASVASIPTQETDAARRHVFG